jgi:methylated-DNA-protein-cysteine methyltransferase-like protein
MGARTRPETCSTGGVIGLDSWLLNGGGLAQPWGDAASAVARQDGGGLSAGLWDQRVWRLVAQIPRARLATYGQVAELLGAWGRARQVGWALRRLPLPSAIPWHRVVNARGCIAMTPSREGSDWIQRDLLVAEGIPVDAQGRVPLARFRWNPSLPLVF